MQVTLEGGQSLRRSTAGEPSPLPSIPPEGQKQSRSKPCAAVQIEAACRCHKKEVQSAAINPPPSPPAQLAVAVVNNEEVKFEFVKEDLETSGRSRISVG
nr:hypothetical protein Iba_chr14aCG3950 [Ipomoea batatas]